MPSKSHKDHAERRRQNQQRFVERRKVRPQGSLGALICDIPRRITPPPLILLPTPLCTCFQGY